MLTLADARKKVLTDIRDLIMKLRSLTGPTPASVKDGIATLRQIRRTSYEDLNQIQHESLILEAADWLASRDLIPPPATMYWNPRQTGDAVEPDLAIYVDGQQVIAAEITTSDNPVGMIDKRMAGTLRKLSLMPGRKFYFVCSPAMCARAVTKVRRRGWPIEVVCLE